jgi:hypothetical protein
MIELISSDLRSTLCSTLISSVEESTRGFTCWIEMVSVQRMSPKPRCGFCYAALYGVHWVDFIIFISRTQFLIRADNF